MAAAGGEAEDSQQADESGSRTGVPVVARQRLDYDLTPRWM